jgi:hypothetical protein
MNMMNINKRGFFISFLFLFAAFAPALLSAPAAAAVKNDGGMYIVDDAQGFAHIQNGNKNAARDEAKRAAYRDALEKAMGACVTGITEMENFAVTRDKVFSKTGGIVKDFKITSETVDEDGIMTVTGVCKVGEKALDGELGPDVIDFLGHPRVMVLVSEMIENEPPFLSVTEGMVLGAFEKAGFLLVDPDQAHALISIDPAVAYNDPGQLMYAARTLDADIIILGRASASPFQTGKIQGITMYGVRGAVQLKAVLTKTAYQISSKMASAETGKKPALSVEEGAERCFEEAALAASEQIVYKIAYNMASAGSSLGGITVNVTISNISFKQVETLMGALSEMAGRSGSVYERSYENGVLKVDVVSEKTAEEVASFLSGEGIEVEGLTVQTVSGKTAGAAGAPPGGSREGSGGVWWKFWD